MMVLLLNVNPVSVFVLLGYAAVFEAASARTTLEQPSYQPGCRVHKSL